MLVKWAGHGTGTRGERHCIIQVSRKEHIVKTYPYIVKVVQWIFILIRQRYLSERHILHY